jgi:integrase/recombinase XerD
MKELGKITFDEFINSCKARNLREYTIKFYDNSIRSIYKFIEPKIPLNFITSKTVESFILGCKKELNIKDIKSRKCIFASKNIEPS